MRPVWRPLPLRLASPRGTCLSASKASNTRTSTARSASRTSTGSFARSSPGRIRVSPARLTAYRRGPRLLRPALPISRLLVEAARPLSRFVARLFGIEREQRAQAADAGPEAALFRFRRDFLQRRAAKAKPPEDAAGLESLRRTALALERDLFPELTWAEDPELATSRAALALLDLESAYLAVLRQKKAPEVEPASREAAAALAARARTSRAPSLPRPADDSRRGDPHVPRPPSSRSTRSGAASGWGADRGPGRPPVGSPSTSPRPWTTRTWSRPSGRRRICRSSARGPRPGGGDGRASRSRTRG